VRLTYRTPTVTSIGGRGGHVRGANGILDVELGIPTELGGAGGKTNPEELFAAAYAACFHGAVMCIAAEKRVPIEASAVDAHVGLCSQDHDSTFMLVAELHVTLPHVDTKTAKDVVRLAHMVCPYSDATRDNIAVTLSVTPADGRCYAVSRSGRQYVTGHA
jgi:lipoyl-dependent peroxiredoxin